MRSGSCPYTVQFYGALFREVIIVAWAYYRFGYIFAICISSKILKIFYRNHSTSNMQPRQPMYQSLKLVCSPWQLRYLNASKYSFWGFYSSNITIVDDLCLIFLVKWPEIYEICCNLTCCTTVWLGGKSIKQKQASYVIN